MEVAFAGRLASMTQREAADRVGASGGRVVREPSERTTYLVVGHGAWPLGSDGLPDRSALRTRRLKERYPDLEIVSETTFLEMLGLTEKVEDLQRLFTTAQLSRILGVPVPQIRTWMRRKLIRPAKVARRLAWFDFREVAMARALHSLTSAGVSTARIGQGIRDLAQWLPDAERMLTQLETLSPDHKLSIRLADGTLVEPTGQHLFDFHGGVPDPEPREPTRDHQEGEPANVFSMATGAHAVEGAAAPIDFPMPPRAPALGHAGNGGQRAAARAAGNVVDLHARAAGGRGRRSGGASAERLFQRGVAAEDAGQWKLAQQLYEGAIEAGGPDPETCFNLGNVLYELDQKRAAAERYREAVSLDDEYVESLNNLGNALAETGWLNDAVHAYRSALHLEPSYADAHSNLAETLVYLGRYQEARMHWAAYLDLDPHSSWATAIRELLDNLPAENG
jgi:tetratricopeptide (TPR) repeat protein